VVADAPADPNGSGDFQFNVTYEETVPANWRPVIDFAVSEWDQLIRSRGFRDGTYPITVRRVALAGNNVLAYAVTDWENNGNLRGAEIVFNTRFNFFADRTPATSDDLPSDQFDLLTLARHELGHAIGWEGTENPRVAAVVANDVLDAARLNIGLNPNDAAHTSSEIHPGDVMNPYIWSGVRRSIALYPTASGPARAFGNLTAMQYVDAGFSGTPSGSVTAPWRSFTEANSSGSSSLPLLLAPRTFPVSASSIFNSNRLFTAARGGAVMSP